MELFNQRELLIQDEDAFVNFNVKFDGDYQVIDKEECESTYNFQHRNEMHLLESLSAVTTHFAHVQFRIRQIIDAPLEEKESLLKDLEEYTFKGIPEIQKMTIDSANEDAVKDCIILDLKRQVEELQRLTNNFQYRSETKSTSENNTGHTICRMAEDNGESDAKMTFDLEGLNIVKKMSSVLRMMKFHCKEEKDIISREYLCTKSKYNHWGDIRARLEIAIAEVINLALEPELPIDSDYMSDSDGGTDYVNSQKLAGVVRKKLAPAIQNLMQHGLISENKTVSVRNSLTFVIACMPHINNSVRIEQTGHAWELILKYYKMKNGDQFNSSPALKLSQSFNLDVGLQCSSSSTQKLLITVGNIISSHSMYKRSYNSQFKAFVCAALNAKMLLNWLQSIYRCRPLIEMYYESWSYAVRTGFEDTFKSIEKLNHYHFNLPVDIAIHQLQNIKDAF